MAPKSKKLPSLETTVESEPGKLSTIIIKFRSSNAWWAFNVPTDNLIHLAKLFIRINGRIAAEGAAAISVKKSWVSFAGRSCSSSFTQR